MFEFTQTAGASTTNAMAQRKCTVLIDPKEVMVSRKIPADILELIGFIEWNRFCDRLDECLQPLRSIAEADAADCCRIKEQPAKTSALESLQDTCDKLSNHMKSINFTLYCPFHSFLVDNWHIQMTCEIVPGQGSRPRPDPTQAIATQVSDTTSTDETNDSTFVQSSDGSQDVGASEMHTPTDLRDDHPLANTDQSNSNDSQAELPTTPNGEDTRTQPVQSNDPTGTEACKSERAASFRRSAGIGVLGIDYIEHEIQPNDTLPGICLSYNITPARLKHANLLSGDNESLLLVPHKMIAIPLAEGFYSRVQETESHDYKLSVLKKRFPKLSQKEATAYLELADWALDDALKEAQEDIAWEKETKNDFF